MNINNVPICCNIYIFLSNLSGTNNLTSNACPLNCVFFCGGFTPSQMTMTNSLSGRIIWMGITFWNVRLQKGTLQCFHHINSKLDHPKKSSDVLEVSASARETFCFFVRPSKIVVESKNFKVSASKIGNKNMEHGILDNQNFTSCVFSAPVYWYNATKNRCSSKVFFFWQDLAQFLTHTWNVSQKGSMYMTPFLKLVGHGGSSRETCNQLQLRPNAFHELQ